MQLAII